MENFDHFVGKTLFIPPIIKMCQTFGWSQYRLGNYAVAIAWLTLLYSLKLDGWFNITLFVLGAIITILSIIRAALSPESKSSADSSGWRMVYFLLFGMDLFTAALAKEVDASLAFWFLLLTASYAFSIKQIPPREKKSKAKAGGEFSKPIVTEITKAPEFYPAENYHQDYYRLNKNKNPYCQRVIAPKLRKAGLEE